MVFDDEESRVEGWRYLEKDETSEMAAMSAEDAGRDLSGISWPTVLQDR